MRTLSHLFMFTQDKNGCVYDDILTYFSAHWLMNMKKSVPAWNNLFCSEMHRMVREQTQSWNPNVGIVKQNRKVTLYSTLDILLTVSNFVN